MKFLEKLILGINLTIFIISLSIVVTLSQRRIYNFVYKDIEQIEYNLPRDTVKRNYNRLMDYLTSPKVERLEFLMLSSSREGIIHFEDVKKIFLFFIYVLPFSTVILVISFIRAKKYHDLSFINHGTFFTLAIPVLIGLPMVLNFEKTFIKFHEVMFSNDYWIFDPLKDPIIRYLPEKLFKINAYVIITIIILTLLAFRALFIILDRQWKRKRK